MSEVVADGIASINYYAKDRSEAVSPPIAYIGKLSLYKYLYLFMYILKLLLTMICNVW